MSLRSYFHKLSAKVSLFVGSPYSFFLAFSVIVAWLITGPMFHYSDTWQLIINTGTTIITFLMVFLIQNTQNRDTKAMQLKLDELLRGVVGARTELVDLEDLTDEELEKISEEFKKLRTKLIAQKIALKNRAFKERKEKVF